MPLERPNHFYQTDTQFSYGLKAQSDASVSKPVKDVIREVLKNKTKLFNLVEKLAGKKIRNELESVFNQHIEPVLKKMLNEYVALSWTDVEKNLYLSLKSPDFLTVRLKPRSFDNFSNESILKSFINDRQENTYEVNAKCC